MITGYNHNVIHCNQVFHIQTEDSGTKYPHIITHLFVGGNIISSKKCSYAHLLEQNLDEMGLEKAVRAMMQEQHKDMLRDLKAGLFDHFATSSESGEAWEGQERPESEQSQEAQVAPPVAPPPAPVSRPTPRIEPPLPPASPELPSAERSSPDNRAANLRGAARMSRRRPPKERPVLTPTQGDPGSKVKIQPTEVITALRSIEIGSNDNWDMLFEDNTPTVPELPDAGMLWESSQTHPIPPIAKGAIVRTIVTPDNKEPSR